MIPMASTTDDAAEPRSAVHCGSNAACRANCRFFSNYAVGIAVDLHPVHGDASLPQFTERSRLCDRSGNSRWQISSFFPLSPLVRR